ncbi:RNA 3'-terminal phosphate cyclase [Exidia glandulosa HHB12029]|uniref:RNA 3'-terminal phosphate cyclase n=1 Tax=Exidia glandulosa HHB12029 TaxID=1314781 RepID=A0A165IYT3_EXIGL|nr:RNA 3'-terminal phosphate cyclase [Exidia glandulosa HHB12029]
MSTLRIDGSTLEGGGQLLRMSVALATLLQRPIAIDKIRNGRTPPGLKAQHTAGIQLVGQLCNATLEGAQKGARSLSFAPGAVVPGSYTADPGTAGSTGLLLQVSLPCLLFSSAASTLTLRGGTNAANAPQIDYTQHIFLPFLKRHFGLDVDLNIARRGYFPKGGGELHVRVPAASPERGPIPSVTLLERGTVISVKGRAYVAGLPERLATEMHDAAVARLSASPHIPQDTIDITAVREEPKNAIGSGSGIVLWAETDTGCRFAGSALGSKGKAFADVAHEAADELLRNLDAGGCVDEYMQDQMIIFIALAQGQSSIACGPLTLHTKTAIWVAEQLTDAKFEIVEQEGDRNVVHCTGIGLSVQPTQQE